MPYRNAVGMVYDSGTYEANMDLAMKIADWSGLRRAPKGSAARGRLLGIGLANYVESSIGSPKERAEISGRCPRAACGSSIGTQPSGPGPRDEFLAGDRDAACPCR